MNLKQDDIDKIQSYIRGESDENEKIHVEKFFLNGEENLFLKDSLEKEWIRMLKENSDNITDINHLLEKIHSNINIAASKKRKPARILDIYMKAAAILLLPLIIGGFLYFYFAGHGKQIADQAAISTLIAPQGSRIEFTLPDGTTGMLNGGSSLTYSIPFAINRMVTLEGEGWFEVKKDTQHPFEIDAGIGTVKVLGTSFNLSAYPSEGYLEVVLYEGSVEFKDNMNNEKVLLTPSEKLICKSGKTTKKIVDPSVYTSWTEGKLVFRGDPMSELTRRIERWYNVKINIADEELKKYTFHATFQDDSLEEVLKFLCLTSPMRYTIIPRKLLPDGTFSKEEITIYKQ